MNDLEARLARSSARGIRQLELVNEMLAGPVRRNPFAVPGNVYYSYKFGAAGVDYKSFQGLRKRLIENGFYFVTTQENEVWELKFSR